MGEYNESAKIIASIALDKNDFKNDYHKLSSLETFFKTVAANVQVRVRNVIVRTRAVNNDAFIIGHPTQAQIGTVVIGAGAGSTGAWGEWMRRRWDWNTFTELSKGTKKGNISIAGGRITLK